ncbi:hypothetical protein VTH06DRAFT_733 [Thermothelomyces fergusii]
MATHYSLLRCTQRTPTRQSSAERAALVSDGVGGSAEGVWRSIDNALRQFNGRQKLDIFESTYINKGFLGGISPSEGAASTIHEADKLAKIVAVEAELSIFFPKDLTKSPRG